MKPFGHGRKTREEGRKEEAPGGGREAKREAKREGKGGGGGGRGGGGRLPEKNPCHPLTFQ